MYAHALVCLCVRVCVRLVCTIKCISSFRGVGRSGHEQKRARNNKGCSLLVIFADPPINAFHRARRWGHKGVVFMGNREVDISTNDKWLLMFELVIGFRPRNLGGWVQKGTGRHLHLCNVEWNSTPPPPPPHTPPNSRLLVGNYRTAVRGFNEFFKNFSEPFEEHRREFALPSESYVSTISQRDIRAGPLHRFVRNNRSVRSTWIRQCRRKQNIGKQS